jgi:hypothetical protein
MSFANILDLLNIIKTLSHSAFVRHQNYRLKMMDFNDVNDDLFKKDSTFLVQPVGKHGRWNELDCKKEFPFVCQLLPYDKPPIEIIWPVSGGCPEDWYSFAGNCYQIPIQNDNAADYASLRGYELAKKVRFLLHIL